MGHGRAADAGDADPTGQHRPFVFPDDVGSATVGGMTSTNDYAAGLRRFAGELLALADADDPAAAAIALAPILARGSDVSAEIRLSEVRRDAVWAVVMQEAGSQRLAAERLGVSPSTVSRLLMTEEARRLRGKDLLERKALRAARPTAQADQ